MNTRQEVNDKLEGILVDARHGYKDNWNMSEPGSTRVRYTIYAFQIRIEVEVLVTIGTVKWKVDRYTHDDPKDLTEGWRLTKGGFGKVDDAMVEAVQFALRQIDLGLELYGRPAYLPDEFPTMLVSGVIKHNATETPKPKKKATPKKAARDLKDYPVVMGVKPVHTITVNKKEVSAKLEKWLAAPDPTTTLLEMHDQENGVILPELLEATSPKPVTLTELAKPFGKDRREREVVKRRFQTLKGKLDGIPDDQRKVFLQWMALSHNY